MPLKVLAAVLLVFTAVLARADVMYTYTGVANLKGTLLPGPFRGTSFTITSPNFLSFSQAGLIPTSGDLVLGGLVDTGAVTAVEFTSNSRLSVGNSTLYLGNVFLGSYEVKAIGTYTDLIGDTFIVSGSPAVTSEPSSFALLATGVLSLAGCLKKRALR